MYCVEKPSSKVWLGQRQCPSRNHLPCTACFSTHIPKDTPQETKIKAVENKYAGIWIMLLSPEEAEKKKKDSSNKGIR